MINTVLIGAGFIASAHKRILDRRDDGRLIGVVDPRRAAAEALAGGQAPVFASVDEMLARIKPDIAHVLTPPPTHRAVAGRLLEAGIGVFLEKPMAETARACDDLLDLARTHRVPLCVNHNFRFHPVFTRARALAVSGRVGTVRHLQMRYAAPLRQLASRQFSHWMFESARNLLLEQAVHPLSLIDEALGGITAVRAQPGPVIRPADGIDLITDWQLSVKAGNGLGQLQVILGASWPSWTFSLLGSDGVIDADLFEGRVMVRRASGAIPPIDHAGRNLATGLAGLGSAARALGEFGAEVTRLGGPADGFSRSMAGSINAFYDAVAAATVGPADQGRRLVAACEAAAAGVSLAKPFPLKPPAPAQRFDVAVIGGTGFVGSHLLTALRERGLSVAVLARGTRNLPRPFHDPQVGVFSGSITDPQALADFCTRAPKIVNLAHGGGGASRAAIADAMVGGAVNVMRAARTAGAERVLYISSSAALYLGDPNETIRMETPPDPQPQARGDYAYAKIMSEEAILAEPGPPAVILRPAVVVGEGTAPLHSALGAFENESHCNGWNAGTNPLPFVLVEDVASAIIAALDTDRDRLAGKALNLVGEVRWSARQYIDELNRATGRHIVFHGQSVGRLVADEWAKYAVKKMAGRAGVGKPSDRDLRSRGMVSPFDIAAEKALLGWQPCADEAHFRARAIAVHAPDAP